MKMKDLRSFSWNKRDYYASKKIGFSKLILQDAIKKNVIEKILVTVIFKVQYWIIRDVEMYNKFLDSVLSNSII